MSTKREHITVPMTLEMTWAYEGLEKFANKARALLRRFKDERRVLYSDEHTAYGLLDTALRNVAKARKGKP